MSKISRAKKIPVTEGSTRTLVDIYAGASKSCAYLIPPVDVGTLRKRNYIGVQMDEYFCQFAPVRFASRTSSHCWLYRRISERIDRYVCNHSTTRVLASCAR